MAAKRTDPYLHLLAAYFAFALFVVLVILVSPIFLAGAALVIGYRLYQAYQHSPARLTAEAHRKSVALYGEAQRRLGLLSFPNASAFADNVLESVAEAVDGKLPNLNVLASLFMLSETLYEAEAFEIDTVPPPPTTPDLIQDARYHDLLEPQLAKLSHPDAISAFHDALVASFVAFIQSLPPIALRQEDSNAFSVRLIESSDNTGDLVEQLLLPLYSERVKSIGLFSAVRRQVDQNLWAASGVARKDAIESKLVFPPQHGGTPEDIVSAYLRHTPFENVFAAEIPFSIDATSRMEHWHLVAGSGHGKTQTLQHVIMRDLQADDPPSLIVIDSQGDMLKKIERLALFEQYDRLIVIDPEDDLSPALNMFDVKSARLDAYSRTVREQVEAGIIELFNYVFGALASELTAKQGTAFAYITRLMLTIPGATIHTFRELMETADPSSFAPHIARLDATSRAFFDNQFFNRSAFGETRQQIARRLYTVLQVPAFERMFASPLNRLDMFAAMQGRQIVLVNTSKALLKTDASALFGRYMIALTLNAAFERIAVPERDRVPAYLIIDEAADYFDATLERLLAQARKFNLGVLFAHQHMDQLSPALRAAVAANTSVKMAGGVSDHDARILAADMRTSADFIGATRKQIQSTDFACYVRNLTDTAVRVTIPFGTLEDAPRMPPEAHAALRARNRARYGVPSADEPADSARPPPDRQSRRHDPDDVDMHATES